MKDYYKKELRLAGSYVNGVELQADDYIVVAQNGKTGELTKGLVSQLDNTQKEKVLEVAKYIKFEEMRQQNQEALKDGLEYPAASGETFDISNIKMGEYVGLLVMINTLIAAAQAAGAPGHRQAGNRGHFIWITSQAELDSFIQAGLQRQGLHMAAYQTAEDAVKAVAMSNGDLLAAIDAVNAINYVKPV